VTPKATAVQGQQFTPANKGTQENPAEQHHCDLESQSPEYRWKPRAGNPGEYLTAQAIALLGQQKSLSHSSKQINKKIISNFILYISSTFLACWCRNGRRIFLSRQ
jgi:hypothetical protein